MTKAVDFFFAFPSSLFLSSSSASLSSLCPQYGSSLCPQYGSSLCSQYGSSFCPQYGSSLCSQYGSSLCSQYGSYSVLSTVLLSVLSTVLLSVLSTVLLSEFSTVRTLSSVRFVHCLLGTGFFSLSSVRVNGQSVLSVLSTGSWSVCTLCP